MTTRGVIKESISILMEGTPGEIEIADLEKELLAIEGVKEIHDLHVWSLSANKLSMSCHISTNSPS